MAEKYDIEIGAPGLPAKIVEERLDGKAVEPLKRVSRPRRTNPQKKLDEAGEQTEIIRAPKSKIFENLGYHEAFMLATLPRKRSDDPSSTPLACMLTAAIPAAWALISGMNFHAWKFDLDFRGSVAVIIFVFCSAWYLVEKRHQKDSGTSMALLEKLRTGAPLDDHVPENVVGRRWWHRRPG